MYTFCTKTHAQRRFHSTNLNVSGPTLYFCFCSVFSNHIDLNRLAPSSSVTYNISQSTCSTTSFSLYEYQPQNSQAVACTKVSNVEARPTSASRKRGPRRSNRMVKPLQFHQLFFVFTLNPHRMWFVSDLAMSWDWDLYFWWFHHLPRWLLGLVAAFCWLLSASTLWDVEAARAWARSTSLRPTRRSGCGRHPVDRWCRTGVSFAIQPAGQGKTGFKPMRSTCTRFFGS